MWFIVSTHIFTYPSFSPYTDLPELLLWQYSDSVIEQRRSLLDLAIGLSRIQGKMNEFADGRFTTEHARFL